jgi:putative oxidoreductase
LQGSTPTRRQRYARNEKDARLYSGASLLKEHLMPAFVSRLEARLLELAVRLAFLGPTLARLTLGLVFIGTGWGKLHDLDKVTSFFTELGIPAPGANALLAASAEFGCGLLLLAGLFSRLASLPLIVTMIVAILTAKRPDLHGLTDLVGFEEWSYVVLASWIAVAGPGPLSLDNLVRLVRRRPRSTASIVQV